MSQYTYIFSFTSGYRSLLQKSYQALSYNRQQIKQGQKLMQQDKQNSVLRSPHANKNSQEHFARVYFKHNYCYQTQQKTKIKEFHNDFNKVLKSSYALTAVSQLKVDGVIFNSFF